MKIAARVTTIRLAVSLVAITLLLTCGDQDAPPIPAAKVLENAGPPPPPVVQYFLAVNGQQQGPFSIINLSQMAMQGQFKPQTLVWKPGMTSWMPASQVPELQAVFSLGPPPPPPPLP